MNIRFAVCMIFCLLFVLPASGAPYSLVVTGSGGVEEYRETFADWGERLVKVLEEKCGHSPEKIKWLAAPGVSSEIVSGTSTLENIKQQIDKFSQIMTEKDIFYIYLIGHGSYLAEKSKFHIEGPDLTAEQLNDFVQDFPAKYVVVINAASSSAGFINALSAENRVICTATRNTDQKHATEFMKFFLQALEEGSADQDHDERVTVWEACRQASKLTGAWYEEKGYLVTENAILDDNGDSLGSRLYRDSKQQENENESGLPEENAAESELDGEIARTIYLKDFVFPQDAPPALVDTYLALLERVEDLKAHKEEIGEATYYQRLETLLIDAAHANRMIRSFAKDASSLAAKTVTHSPSDSFPSLNEIDFSEM